MVSVSQHVMVCKHREVSGTVGTSTPDIPIVHAACTYRAVDWKVNLSNVDGELSFVTYIGKEWTIDFLQLTVYKDCRVIVIFPLCLHK